MRRSGVLLLAVLGAAACRRAAAPRRVLPSPIAIELSGPAAAPSPELAPRLAAIGVASFFVPAVAADASPGTAAFRTLDAPPRPFPGRVYLEVTGRGDFGPLLERDPSGTAAALWRVLEPATRVPWGTVAGVHVAWRVSRSARGLAVVLAELRRRVPGAWTLSAAIAGPIPEGEEKGWRSAAEIADFVVAETFGRGEDFDPSGFVYSASLDQAAALGPPVYVGLAPQGWGVLRAVDGAPRGTVFDAAINALSEDRRFDFSFGDVLSDPDESVYVFRATRAAESPRWGPVRPGETITFRERRVGDYTKALSEGRGARGKVVRLASLEDDGRGNGFGTLEDVLLGRSLEPKLSFSRAEDNAIVAVNGAAANSELSRINTWIDVTVADARILDVRPGDFDRFVLLDERGRPALEPRARTIRFFENFIASGESMRSGPIRLSKRAAMVVRGHIATVDGKMLVTPPVTLK